MIRRCSILALVVAAGCTPNNAELPSGSFTTWLSATTSKSVLEGNAFNTKDSDGNGIPDVVSDEGSYMAIDCRVLDNEENRLPGAAEVCHNDAVGVQAEDGTWFDVEHEAWINFGAFHVWSEPLDVWRGEAIQTSEGDMHVTFHHRLPGGEDFRFAFVIDPLFQPRICEESESGDLGWRWIDGDTDGDGSDDTSWVDAWSDTMSESGPADPLATDSETVDYFDGTGKDGNLYFINTYAYQFNPSDTAQIWAIPQEWGAGYARARFGPEDFFTRKPRYGLPAAYGSWEQDEVEVPASALFYSDMDSEADPYTDEGHLAEIARVRSVANKVHEEFALMGDPNFRPVVHTNQWRAPDGKAPGLDSWVGMHYSWVRLDQNPEDVVVGEPVSGEFMLFFDGQESQSRLIVRGEFTADKLKKDRWTTDVVAEEKYEENQTYLCGEPAWTE